MLRRKEPGFTRFRVMSVCCTRYFDIRKAKAVLKYEPIVNLNEGVTRACKVTAIQSVDFPPAHMVYIGLFRGRILQGHRANQKMKPLRNGMALLELRKKGSALNPTLLS